METAIKERIEKEKELLSSFFLILYPFIIQQINENLFYNIIEININKQDILNFLESNFKGNYLFSYESFLKNLVNYKIFNDNILKKYFSECKFGIYDTKVTIFLTFDYNYT